MSVECYSLEFDHRLQTYLVSCRSNYAWFLTATQGAEQNLQIQRDIIKGQKTYATLRQDLKRGCVLPPLVLSVQEIRLPAELSAKPAENYIIANDDTLGLLVSALSTVSPGNVQIIDGLQRTNAIRSVFEELDPEEQRVFLIRPIRFEVWINIRLDALAYRMLLLNAGQKPMSMKHQIEVLADSMRASLTGTPNLDIIRGIDKRRRTQPGQFQLSLLTGAFQAWLQRSPNVDLRNAITEQLLSEEAIDELGKGLSPSAHQTGDRFKKFVAWLVELDFALGPNHLSFLGNETVVHALSAAVSKLSATEGMEVRCDEAQSRLLHDIRSKGAESALAPHLFSAFRQEIDPKKQNVGDATRLFVFRAFSEYIVSSGSSSMPDAWTFASQYLK